MPVKSTEVTAGRLTQVADTLADAIARYAAAVDKYNDCSAEFDVKWDGEEGNRFICTLTPDRERLDVLRDALACCVEVLNQKANNYARAEEELLRLFDTNGTKRDNSLGRWIYR